MAVTIANPPWGILFQQPEIGAKEQTDKGGDF